VEIKVFEDCDLGKQFSSSGLNNMCSRLAFVWMHDTLQWMRDTLQKTITTKKLWSCNFLEITVGGRMDVRLEM
jgi:hypothetical protein